MCQRRNVIAVVIIANDRIIQRACSATRPFFIMRTPLHVVKKVSAPSRKNPLLPAIPPFANTARNHPLGHNAHNADAA